MSVNQATEYSSRVPFVQLGSTTLTDFTTANIFMLCGYCSTTGSNMTVRKAFTATGYKPPASKTFYARHMRVIVETTNFTSGGITSYANTTDLGMNSAGGGVATQLNGAGNVNHLFIQNVAGTYETSLFVPFPTGLYISFTLPTITVSGTVTLQLWGYEG